MNKPYWDLYAEVSKERLLRAEEGAAQQKKIMEQKEEIQRLQAMWNDIDYISMRYDQLFWKEIP